MTSLFFSFLISGLILCIMVLIYLWQEKEFIEPTKPFVLDYVPYRIVFESNEEYSVRCKEAEEENKKEREKAEYEYKNEVQEYEDNIARQNRRSIIFTIIAIMVFISIFCLAYFSISYLRATYYEKQIAGYEAQKITIEQSLDNEDLSGLERIELVNNASELNEWLAEEKIEISKWTKFDIYSSVKEQYANAEYINLT